jgi:hypothetical protein
MFKNRVTSKYEITATATPWGASQTTHKVMNGLTWYSTAGHGGLCVSKGLADKKLSPNAREEGIKYGGSYWYEEDAQWVIPVYENPEWLKLMLDRKIFSSVPTMDELKAKIERYFPDYFKAGQAEVVEFKVLKEGDLLYIDKVDAEPYTVKSVSGDQAVITKDGTNYKFSKKSYFSRIRKVMRDGKALTK